MAFASLFGCFDNEVESLRNRFGIDPSISKSAWKCSKNSSIRCRRCRTVRSHGKMTQLAPLRGDIKRSIAQEAVPAHRWAIDINREKAKRPLISFLTCKLNGLVRPAHPKNMLHMKSRLTCHAWTQSSTCLNAQC